MSMYLIVSFLSRQIFGFRRADIKGIIIFTGHMLSLCYVVQCFLSLSLCVCVFVVVCLDFGF